MWVGTTYYFTWLDARLTEEEKAALNTGNAAQIWMVHSGGFYLVEKRKVPDRAFAQASLVSLGSGHDLAQRHGLAAADVLLSAAVRGLIRTICEIQPWVAIAIGIGTFDRRLAGLRPDEPLAAREK